MAKKGTAMRSTFLLALLAAMFAALPSAAPAAPKVRCTGAPFSFSDIQTTRFLLRADHLNFGWIAPGTTTFDCVDGSILTIDVWEHAYAATNGSGRMMGRVQVAVSVPDGGTVLLGGIIRASDYGCEDGICVVDTEVRANGRRGAKLRMLQRATIDLQTRMVVDVDVASIVIEFTGAG
jgi:hypothetical protein